MNKKYVLTDETKIIDGHVLHRIKALIDFNDVKKGDLGGFVESEDNLSHDSICWVYDDVCVFENARVYDEAQVYDNAKVFGNAQIFEYADTFGYAKVYDNAKVHGNAKVYGNVRIFNEISGIATVCGDAEIFGNAKVHGNAEVCGYAKVFGDAEVFKNVKICGNAKLYDKQYIKYGTVTKDILKEKDWGLALRCIDETIEIKNNKIILYEALYKTRNKNIFISNYWDKFIIFEKNKIINFPNIIIIARDLIEMGSMYNAKCEIYLNDISLVNANCISCKKIKILDIVKGGAYL